MDISSYQIEVLKYSREEHQIAASCARKICIHLQNQQKKGVSTLVEKIEYVHAIYLDHLLRS